MTSAPIRVLVVSDGSTNLAPLLKLLHASPDFEVATAPAEPRRLISHLQRTQPHVVCIDVADGQAAPITQLIMADDPRPILVLASSSNGARSADTFAVLDAGAVDVMPRPAAGPTTQAETAELRAKLRVLAGVRVTRRRARDATAPARNAGAHSQHPKAVVIGASTGGPIALAQILAELPRSFPLPVLCVQHIARGFLPGFAEWLDRHCELRVKQADEGESPRSGNVYLPRDDMHLLVDAERRLTFSHEPPIDGHRPSVTVTMRSVARRYEGAVVGVLLTGMGRDGVDGMREIANLGGVTIAQDETTSAVFGMPSQAIAAGCVHHVLALDKIGPRLAHEASMAR